MIWAEPCYKKIFFYKKIFTKNVIIDCRHFSHTVDCLAKRKKMCYIIIITRILIFTLLIVLFSIIYKNYSGIRLSLCKSMTKMNGTGDIPSCTFYYQFNM